MSSNPDRFRPLLAASLDDGSITKLPSRIIVSPKVDGIRVLCHPTLGPVTRSLKPVPNAFIRSYLSHPRLFGLDGEIVVGDLKENQVFNQTTSGVMSMGGMPNFTYHVFDMFYDKDCWYNHIPYHGRLATAKLRVESWEDESIENAGVSRVTMLSSQDSDGDEPELTRMAPPDFVDFWEEEYLRDGFEGLMIRRWDGPYKFGRSTFKEGTLIKVKRFEDAEAVIEGFEELERNQNAPVRNVLGYTERSDHKAGKERAGTLGALVVRADPWGCFNVGSGFDASTRDRLWAERETLIGKTIKFKHQKVGQVDKPRFPIFLGFRGDE